MRGNKREKQQLPYLGTGLSHTEIASSPPVCTSVCCRCTAVQPERTPAGTAAHLEEFSKAFMPSHSARTNASASSRLSSGAVRRLARGPFFGTPHAFWPPDSMSMSF